MIPFFKPCKITYDDSNIDDPVLYTEDFLKEIADKTGEVSLTDGHDGAVIGSLTGFTVKDGVLYCDEPDGVDLKGLGLSPTFNAYMLENDGFVEAVDGELTTVALTDKPRSHILYNSYDGGKNMSESNMDRMFEMTSKLEKEKATLENQLNGQSKALKKAKQVEKELEELKAENAELNKKIEAYTPKVEGYDKIITGQKKELITKIAGENEEYAKKLESWDIGQLEDFIEMKTVNKPARGVNTNVAEGYNHVEPKEDKDEYTGEDFIKDYKAAYGNEPALSF